MAAHETWNPATLRPLQHQPDAADLIGADGALLLPEPNVAKLRFVFDEMKRVPSVSSSDSVAKIGPSRTEPVVNPASRASGLTYVAGLGPVPSETVPQTVMSDAQYARMLEAHGAISRRVYGSTGEEGLFRSAVDALFGTLTPNQRAAIANLPPPKLILPEDMLKWHALPGFPVGLYYPQFPAGRVTGGLMIDDTPPNAIPFLDQIGLGVGGRHLYYRVEKLLPFGQTVNEPYASGQYMVRADAMYRVTLATVQILVEYDTVTMLSKEGYQFPVRYLDYLNDDSPEYVMAKRLVMMQYPQLTLSLFSVKNLAEAPPQYRAGATRLRPGVPSGLASTPAILVPQ